MSLKKTLFTAAAGLGLAALPIAQAQAVEVSVGGGLRTSFTATDLESTTARAEPSTIRSATSR